MMKVKRKDFEDATGVLEVILVHARQSEDYAHHIFCVSITTDWKVRGGVNVIMLPNGVSLTTPNLMIGGLWMSMDTRVEKERLLKLSPPIIEDERG